MPRLSAVAELEGPARHAHEAISNGPRLGILRTLLHRGALTRAQVTEATGLSASATLDALRELEQLGYVSASVDGNRVGRRVEYTIDRSSLTADLFDFMGWLLS